MSFKQHFIKNRDKDWHTILIPNAVTWDIYWKQVCSLRYPKKIPWLKRLLYKPIYRIIFHYKVKNRTVEPIPDRVKQFKDAKKWFRGLPKAEKEQLVKDIRRIQKQKKRPQPKTPIKSKKQLEQEVKTHSIMKNMFDDTV